MQLKIAALLLDSIGIPIEIEEHLEHGQDAHDTFVDAALTAISGVCTVIADAIVAARLARR